MGGVVVFAGFAALSERLKNWRDQTQPLKEERSRDQLSGGDQPNWSEKLIEATTSGPAVATHTR